MLLGLRTVIYPAPDLPSAKAWFTALLEIEPYFDQPFYVGYQVAGYELALDPDADPDAAPITYWGVPNADVALAKLRAAGAEPDGEVQDVGDDIRTARFRLPTTAGGSIFGVIENPHFVAADTRDAHAGPGR